LRSASSAKAIWENCGLKVTDPAGLGLPASVTLVSEANQFRQTYITRAAGDLDARGLPFAVYRFRVTQQGFSTIPERLRYDPLFP